jgi:hypothetical protein
LLNKLSTLLSGKQADPQRNLLDEFYRHDLTKELKKPVDKDGQPIPWYTYPAIEYLEQFDLSGLEVFEWGCGNSSLFYANRVKKVTSVEHDTEWFNQMSPGRKANQELALVPLKDYPAAIRQYGRKFDIIVIDGQRRFDCTRQALEFLQPGGMIILDNSDWFYLSAALLREKMGLIEVDFHGFGPINPYTWTTSVFLSRDLRLPLKKDKQPLNPLGGLLHDEKEIIENEDREFGTQNGSWIKDGYK